MDTLYESHYTHHFFRLWGAKEGAATGKIKGNDLLLGNAQNSFDAKLGDVVGKLVNSENKAKYFLVEFKRTRSGIADELISKPHRGYLMSHLRADPTCGELSLRAHYAGYAKNGQLAFEPYGNAANAEILGHDMYAAFTIVGAYLGVEKGREALSFDQFYEILTEGTPKASVLKDISVGVDHDDFGAYIECMYAQLESATADDGRAMLGAYHPLTGEFFGFTGTVTGLIKSLHKYFEAHRVMQNSTPDSEPEKPSTPRP